MQRDIGAYIQIINAFNPRTVTNTTAGDNVELTSTDLVDREIVSPGKSLQLSGKVGIPYNYNLAAANTLTITANVQHSSGTTTTFTDFADKDSSTSFSVTVGTTTSTAAQTGSGVLKTDLDLGGAKRYLRLQITPNFAAQSTAGTSDVDLGGVVVLGGYDNNPASTS